MATYIVSPDGSTVYRIVPQGSVSASSLNASLLTAFGYTVTTGSTGTLTVSPYEAGWTSGNVGGGHIEAVYNHVTALAPGQTLEWIQVVTTNFPTQNRSVTGYLDNIDTSGQNLNPGASAFPFYALTAVNMADYLAHHSLGANAIPFYDFSARGTLLVSTNQNVVWNAALYPVIVSGNNIIVENGVTWGWTAKKATIGTDSAIFLHASPGSATVTGVGTSHFTWGQANPDVSSLDFAGGSFDTSPGVRFKLGTLTYHNGTIVNATGATSVDFDAAINFTNVPEKNTHLTATFGLVNSVNTDDPRESADIVDIGSLGYKFRVYEGDTATVDVYATLSTNLAPTPANSDRVDSVFSVGPFASNPIYGLKIVGLANASSGGFIQLDGDDGDNTLVGGPDDDTINGLGGNDTIQGLEDTDFLNGGSGQDTITGGRGKDMLTGGSEQDIFDFNVTKDSVKGSNRDEIVDFSHLEGDKIDLSTIDANTHRGGNQRFHFIGSETFKHHQQNHPRDVGMLRYSHDVVQGDVNGDGRADFEISIENFAALARSDFVL